MYLFAIFAHYLPLFVSLVELYMKTNNNKCLVSTYVDLENTLLQVL